ncbi:unnamed protein product [Rhizoctonia solani]|uniref:Peptide hydrolase n=1 Tax=Rhizoctonia solani TaxID=456999 RepID=A0A8H3AWZ4_9AGAM|nr:unnamed protein product [Rhizoctonia solani]
MSDIPRARVYSTVMVRFVPLVFASSLISCACANSIEETTGLPLSSEQLQNDIQLSALKEHAKALQGIADKSNGTRVFGSNYVASIVEKAGYDIQYQTFPHEYAEVITQKLTIVPETPINITAMGYSPSTPPGGLIAPLILIAGPDAPSSVGCTPNDFNGVDVQGKIALIQRGNCSFATKNENAKSAGAVGVIVYNNVDGPVSGTLGASNATAYVPIGGISQADGQSLAGQLSNNHTIDAELELETSREIRYSSNVIATSKGGNQSNIVFIGSHLDSVAAGPGINDNGSGSITVLELAVQLAKYKLKNAVRFAWWTAEEVGLIGSTYYVNNLPESERKKIALYINLDMVASPNYVLAVYDGDGSAGTNPDSTPAGSGAIEKVLTDYFASKNLSSVPTSFDGRSDYGPFIAKGVDIPSGGLFTGAEGKKTEEQAKMFGGTAGVAYDVNYHAKGDTYDNLNFDAFLINAEASAHALATFVESTKLLEDEKAAARVSSKVASMITAAPNDALVVQGKSLCAGELA